MRTVATALLLLLIHNSDASFFRQEEHKLAANYYGDGSEMASVPLHRRVKRAFLAAVGYATPCAPGWTGQFCEHPMCVDRSPPLTPFETDMDKMVDTLYLPENCAGSYYVPYDSTTEELTITVTTNRGRPIVNLTDSQGNVIPAYEQTANDGHGIARYRARPGPYSFSIELASVPTQVCIVHIAARSKATFDAGFVFSPYGDRPPYGESSEVDLPAYFVAHPFNLESPSEIRTVTIRNVEYLQPMYRSLLTRRYDCAYEFYAGEFTCHSGHQYIYIIDGVDDKGFAFRRSHPFACFSQEPTRQPPLTTPFPVADCRNGGTFINNTGTPYCFCRELFTGRQCDEALCMNGGYQVPSDPFQCDCSNTGGFVGQNCDSVICNRNVGPLLTDEKQLVVVVRDSASMAPAIPSIVGAIQDELFFHDFDGRNAYNGFVLVTYNGEYLTAQSYMTNQISAFIDDLTALKDSTKTSNCTDNVMTALRAAFFKHESLKSPIFVFADVPPNDSDDAHWQHIAQLNAVRKQPIVPIIILNTTTTTACDVDYNDRRFTALKYLAIYSGGLTHTPEMEDLRLIFMLAMRGFTYRMNLVETADIDQCDVRQKTFFVDSSTEFFIVMARGKDLKFFVTDPKWFTQEIKPIFHDERSYFFEIPRRYLQRPGEFLYDFYSTTDKSSGCSYRMFTQSDFDFFLATTNKLDTDMISEEPTVGIPTHIVAQLNGFYGGYVHDELRLFAEILITVIDDRGQLVPAYYSNGVWRSSCGFHLYFGIADFCQYDDQPFYATVFVDDRFGYTVQRSTVGYCNPKPVIPTPSPDSCQHGGVAFNSTFCLCPAHFTGTRCEQIECQNGGTPYGERCICPYGLTGRYCEIMSCPVQNLIAHISPDQQSFSMILSTRKSMRSNVKALAEQVDEFARDYYSNSPAWLFTFNIVLVSQTNVSLVTASSAREFAEALKKISQNFDQYTDENNNDCPVMINDGINLALLYSFEYSPIFVFADSPSSNVNITTLVNILDVADMLHVPIHFYGLDPNMCNTNGSFGDHELILAEWTGGQVVFSQQPKVLLMYILTFYNSGLVAGRVSNNCTTTGIDFYFPVDAQAKAFTVVVAGSNTKLEIIPPDNNPGLYKNIIIEESRTVIHQYIPACEQGWDANGQYCHQFGTAEISWTQAFVQCADANPNAFLVDILTQQQYDFLKGEIFNFKIWLGLVKNGTTSNDFYFYQPNGENIPLNSTFAKDFWAPNQDFANPELLHVYMDGGDGKWYLAPLSAANAFVCQMPRYGKGFEPTTMDTPLPAGFWRAKVTGESDFCSMEIRMQSPVQVYYGFVQDPHNDFVRDTANVDSANNYVVATATGLGSFNPRPGPTNKGKLDYVFAFGDFSSKEPMGILPLPFSPRAECTFDSLSTPFKCPPISDGNLGSLLDPVALKFTGIDQFGFPFQRFMSSRCDKYITRCYNGGFAHNGVCVCPRDYSGVDCRVPVCQNGGKSKLDGTCVCPAVYTGKFCQHAACDPPYPGNFPTEGRTLIIALETSFEMQTAIFFLRKNLTDALKKNKQLNPSWFTRYVFYPFNTAADKDSWPKKVETYNLDDIDKAIRSIVIDELPSSDVCPRPISFVLKDILTSPYVEYPEATIIVITHSAVEDYGLQSELLPIIQEKKPQIFFTLIDAPSPCNLGWNNPATAAMQFYASITNGNVFTMVPLDLITGFFYKYLPALYKQQMVSVTVNRGIRNCADAEFVFQIDYGTTEFIVEHYAENVQSLDVIGPKGLIQKLPPLIMQSSSDYIAVFEIDPSEIVPGTYVVRSESSGSVCALNVRASTSIQIIPGYIQVHDQFNGATQDDAHFAPLNSGKNVLIVHAEGLTGGRLETAIVVAPNRESEMVANLVRRDSQCTYTYYADQAFECNYMVYEVIIYGVDSHGQQFHRNFYTHCVSDRPPLPSPPASCDLTTFRGDILFILDTSKALNDSGVRFSEVELFVYLWSIRHQIGAPETQVAIMTLSDQPKKGGFFLLNQATEDNFFDLLETLSNDGGEGQNLTLAIETLRNEFLIKGAGYRVDNSVKHHVVFVTANASPTDVDPANAVLSLRDDGLAGFSVIGLNIRQPSQKLLSLVNEDCRFFVKTLNNLYTDASNFLHMIHCSRYPRCGI